MNNKRKTADGYERWMVKAANNGAAVFGDVEKFDDKDSSVAGGRRRIKEKKRKQPGRIGLDSTKKVVMMMKKVLGETILI